MTSSLKQKIDKCYIRKKSKNAYKKRKNENFECVFSLMSQGSLNPKIRFLAQKLWSVARVQTETETDTHESEY